jgi:hypothetical protein
VNAFGADLSILVVGVAFEKRELGAPKHAPTLFPLLLPLLPLFHEEPAFVSQRQASLNIFQGGTFHSAHTA